MEKIIIRGPCKISGAVNIVGAKNAALPILCASILSRGTIQLQNIPQLRDTATMLDLLGRLGAGISIHDSGEIKIDPRSINRYKAEYDLVKTMRASILVLGPLLARFKRAVVSLPGGCAIGSRPIDLHLKALQCLGAKIDLHDGYIEAKVIGRLKGAHISFDNTSVGATENAIMAASLADGQTIISGAATEPEVVDLANFLNGMGAKIEGAGTQVIKIDGVDELNGYSHSVIPDRIEAGTFLIAAAMTRGRIKLTGVNPEDLIFVLEKLKEVGADINTGKDWISLDMHGSRPRAISISTGTFPLFPTDLQAQWLALASVSEGRCTVEENIFENRFMHLHELKRMTADLDLRGNCAHVTGKDILSAAEVMSTDLRASASLVLAALVAAGETIISRVYHIDRGYAFIEEKLRSLGVDVERV